MLHSFHLCSRPRYRPLALGPISCPAQLIMSAGIMKANPIMAELSALITLNRNKHEKTVPCRKNNQQLTWGFKVHYLPSVTAPAECPHPFLLFKLVRFPIPGLVCGLQEFICLLSRAVIIAISLTYGPLSNLWKLVSGARNMAHIYERKSPKEWL